MYGENKGEAGGRKKECLREKWVGGWRWLVEKICSIQKPLAIPQGLKEEKEEAHRT